MQTAHLVYPGAKYTRKEHSLGVMHLSYQAILQILFSQSRNIRHTVSSLQWGKPVIVEENELLDFDLSDQPLIGWWKDAKKRQLMKHDHDKIIQSVRLAGLLHDIGHGPFSHLLEEACKTNGIKMKIDGKTIDFNHEIMSVRIIEEKSKELGLPKDFGPDYICPILLEEGEKRPTFIHELISSGYDCDKLDYLMRDSYHAGTREYGFLDYERILSGLIVKDGGLRISKKAIDALMNSFDAIQYMYTSVYYHKTVRIFDLMLIDAFSEIPEFLEELISDVNTYLKFDDYSLICEVKKRSKPGEDNYKRASKIFEDFLNRKKHYAEIDTHRCSFNATFLRETREKEFKKIEKDLKDIAGDFEIKIDYAPDIKPIGLKSSQILGWLIEKVIFDPDDPKDTKTIEDVCKAYFNKLKKYVILFRIYANKEQDDSEKYDKVKKDIINSAKLSIKDLEEKYGN